MKEKLPLNEQDVKKLRKHLIPVVIFPFLAVGMFYGFFALFFNDGGSALFEDDVAIYIFAGFSLFFFGVIAYMIWSFAIDLRRGFKYRIEGKITDKKLRVSTSGTNSTRTGGSSSSTSRYYYLYIDGVQYSVDSLDYGKVNVGAEVIMDKAPKSNVTLLLELSNEDELSAEKFSEASANERKFLESKIREVQFTEEDFSALKRGIRSQIKSRIVWLLPFVFIDVSLIISEMHGILIFLFPLVIIPAYQLWKSMREIGRYNSNKLYAIKQGVPAIIEDKSKFSSNRSGGSNNVKTSHGILKVTDELYNKLTPDDKIILFKPAKGKQFLSLVTTDSEEFYLM
jgi:hypothetical protein